MLTIQPSFLQKNMAALKKDWFKIKSYSHIGLKYDFTDRAWIERYVRNPKKIEKHSFLPFIHRKLTVRKFRKEVAHDGTRSKLRKPDKKDREIFYSSHLDSHVYGYYARIISRAYEKALHAFGIQDCVTAYRSIRFSSENESRNKCNIDFANDVFIHIKDSAPRYRVAITFDIKSFFDNLNHKILKQAWRDILQSGKDLPLDHYNVFRNITKFSYIREDEIFDMFKNKILVEREPEIVKTKKIAHKKYLINQRAVAYCNNSDIINIRSSKLIKSNKYYLDSERKKILRTKGIPQGSPISAILANVYMLEFDKSVHHFLKTIGGFYRRYSDDMIVVCDLQHEKEVIDYFERTIDKYCLEIQKGKTQIFHFSYSSTEGRYYCFEKNVRTKKLLNNTTFEYLGFQFDGRFILLKNASLAGFYRKMKRSIARSTFYAYHNKTKSKGQFFKNRLYKRFTHLGSKRRRVYVRKDGHSNQFILSNRYDWGNYLTYTKMASRIMSENKIKNQIKRHWSIFQNLLKHAEGLAL